MKNKWIKVMAVLIAVLFLGSEVVWACSGCQKNGKCRKDRGTEKARAKRNAQCLQNPPPSQLCRPVGMSRATGQKKPSTPKNHPSLPAEQGGLAKPKGKPPKGMERVKGKNGEWELQAKGTGGLGRSKKVGGYGNRGIGGKPKVDLLEPYKGKHGLQGRARYENRKGRAHARLGYNDAKGWVKRRFRGRGSRGGGGGSGKM